MFDLTSLFASPAAAQTADAATPSAGGSLASLVPLLLIFVVFYFIVIRPQQKKIKAHAEMVKSVRRGDKVVTAGGIVGQVTKVDAGENLLEVEIASDVRVRVLASTITELKNRGVASEVSESEEKKNGKRKAKK